MGKLLTFLGASALVLSVCACGMSSGSVSVDASRPGAGSIGVDVKKDASGTTSGRVVATDAAGATVAVEGGVAK